MVNQTKRKQEKRQPNFKVSDVVAVKIDKVNNTSPLHPNMLLEKININLYCGKWFGENIQPVWENRHPHFSFMPISLYSHLNVLLNHSTEDLSHQPVRKQVGFQRNSTNKI